jgi:hypothetical protein
MGWIALVTAIAALVAALLPSPGMFLAMGLGIGALGLGWTGYRRREEPGPRRLAGAAGIALAVLALGLGGLRYGLTLAAVDRLERMLGAGEHEERRGADRAEDQDPQQDPADQRAALDRADELA